MKELNKHVQHAHVCRRATAARTSGSSRCVRGGAYLSHCYHESASVKMEGDRCAFVINCQHLCSYIAVVLCTPSVRSVLALVCSVLSLDKSGIDTLTPL